MLTDPVTPLLGLIEFAGVHEGEFRVQGWGGLLRERILAWTLEVDGEGIMTALPRPREDLKAELPGIAHPENAGFEFACPDWPDRPSRCRVEVTAIDEARRPRGRLRVDVDPSLLTVPLPPESLRRRVARSANSWLWRFHALKCLGDFRACWREHLPAVRERGESRGAGPPRVLDWGCGSGRLTALLAKEDGFGEVHGCDVDLEAIAWCREHVPVATFETLTPGAPLPYRDGGFDLVLGFSVLSHLPEALEAEALRELRRVLRPGGLALLSTHGETALAAKHPLDLPRLLMSGRLDRGPDDALAGVVAPEDYREVFHAESWIRSVWGSILTLADHLPAGIAGYQDLVVLRHAILDRGSTRGRRTR